jgi:hypothetical protein
MAESACTHARQCAHGRAALPLYFVLFVPHTQACKPHARNYIRLYLCYFHEAIKECGSHEGYLVRLAARSAGHQHSFGNSLIEQNYIAHQI